MRLPFVAQTGCCSVCARPVEGFGGEYLCEECRRNRPFFDRAATALWFDGDARRMLLDFKFNAHLWLRDDFADWLDAAMHARFNVSAVDLVVPMPSSPLHRWDRGYSQCEPLARCLSGMIARRFDPHVLVRRGGAMRQSSLPEAARRENVKNTFAVVRPESVRGRTALVVDDVLTTGSTFSEAARVLKDAGASRVWVVALARSTRCC